MPRIEALSVGSRSIRCRILPVTGSTWYSHGLPAPVTHSLWFAATMSFNPPRSTRLGMNRVTPCEIPDPACPGEWVPAEPQPVDMPASSATTANRRAGPARMAEGYRDGRNSAKRDLAAGGLDGREHSPGHLPTAPDL